MEDRYIGLQIAALVLSMLFTVAVRAQRPTGQTGGVIVQSTPGVSQETRDALQDARLNQISVDTDRNTTALVDMKAQLIEVNSALVRLNGIGFGFGSLLTALLALDVYFRVRSATEKRGEP